MAENTFRSPGFFPREVDLGIPTSGPNGIPAGIVGTSLSGPAFVPVTVGNMSDFEAIFGPVDPDRMGPYAVQMFLNNKKACTFMRVLGAGSNDSTSDVQTTKNQGTVKNAGFSLTPQTETFDGISVNTGLTQFILSKRFISGAQEGVGFPIFSHNDSFPGPVGSSAPGDDKPTESRLVNLVNAILFTATGSRFQVLDYNVNTKGVLWETAESRFDFAKTNPGEPRDGFKLVLSCTDGTLFASDDDVPGARIYSCSLDPLNDNYISKILNTDPRKFQEEKHFLYAHFPVDHTVAPLWDGKNALYASGTAHTAQQSGSIAIASGSAGHSNSSADTSVSFNTLYGKFNTRYTTPRTTWFTSQPYGDSSYNLFYFETISDGAYANDRFKISIAGLKASLDPVNPYPTFEVQVRLFDDVDETKEIIERYPNVNLNPNSDRFVGKAIGDVKRYFDFDQGNVDERIIRVSGKYPNVSRYIRIVLNDDLFDGDVPKNALPFGFRGIPVLKTSDSLTDHLDISLSKGGKNYGSAQQHPRLWFSGSNNADPTTGRENLDSSMSGSIVPPLPFRFKVTKGKMAESPSTTGEAGSEERAFSGYYWGVQNTSMVLSKSDTGGSPQKSNTILEPNAGAKINEIVRNYTRFMGIEKLDALVTGTGADLFNNNEFTLARVRLATKLDSNNHISFLSGTVKDAMTPAAYIRNGTWETSRYTMKDPRSTAGRNGITLATLLNSSSVQFNRFSDFAKFTNIFYGGFDGLNILDNDQALMNDRSASDRKGGKANSSTTVECLATNPAGTGINNGIIQSYRLASRVMTSKWMTNINILAIPGIRDGFVTDYAMDNCADYGLAIYPMDLEPFDEDGNRLWDDSTENPDVDETSQRLQDRVIDSSYGVTYFPDVYIEDTKNNNSVVQVPTSVVAVGALAFTDREYRPWFAPAGFSRGALNQVRNTRSRLTAGDRDTLYEASINPIATFPTTTEPEFVIFGQKTLQLAQTALDRINVRRMLIDVKRAIITVSRNLVFEQNTPAIRARFISRVTPILAIVQAQQGIEKFRVIMDDSNNTLEDAIQNKLNGSIIIVPTRTVEFIAMDFIIDTAGVTFKD